MRARIGWIRQVFAFSCQPPPTVAPMKILRLGFVLYEGCMPAGLFAAADMVRACNLRNGRARIETSWVGLDLAPVHAAQAPALKPERTLDQAECDAWLVPGAWLTGSDELDSLLRRQQRLVEALRRLPARAGLWSYCTGVALAAAAGRLDRRCATAAWWLQPTLTERFPRVRWQAMGASNGVEIDGAAVTAAGPGGYLPLLLDRLGSLYPSDVLRDMQDALVLPAPRLRHDAFRHAELGRLGDARLRRLCALAQRWPAEDVGVPAAAAALNVSPRTLERIVKQGTGLSAGTWLRRIKLHQAGEALRTSRRPLKAVAEELGFGSESGLHRSFKLVTGLTPAAYRQAFGQLP